MSTTSDESVSFSLELNVEQSMQDLRRVQTALFRILGLMRKHFGDDRFDAVISKLMQMLATLNQVRLALAALQVALAGSGPIGWLLLGVSAAVAVSSADTLIQRPNY